MKYVVFILSVFTSFYVWSQESQKLDFTHAKADLFISPLEKRVSGTVTYAFDVLADIDTIKVDARSMQFDWVEVDDNSVAFIESENQLLIPYSLVENSKHSLVMKYSVNPKKAMYFVGWDNAGRNQIWTQGQGKYTSHWLPSFDDMNEKVEFDLSITFNKGYEVIANGKLLKKVIVNDSLLRWSYDMDKPMSSYLLAIAIGKYSQKNLKSSRGIPMNLYYYPEYENRFEPTYRYSKEIFDFLEKEIGVPFPWQNYKQIPVHDFLYSGMENTSATIFSDIFFIDKQSFPDRNYVTVNAHELAHQWFGDLVTETSGAHHWLQEGFATYFAMLAERSLFGDDHFYWGLYESAEQLKDQEKAGNGTALLNPKSSSLTFYQKGALALYMLREEVGDDAFRNGVKNYLTKYKFKNVTTDDFIREIEKTSKKNLSSFVDIWLKSDVFEFDDVVDHLRKKSKLIDGYLSIECFSMDCEALLESDSNYRIKQKIVTDLNVDGLASAFQVDDLKVRQAIAQSISNIPLEYKTDYESLLNDPSYATIEAALYHLWVNFPDERYKYLDKTKDVVGFNDKNVRMLWLVLSLSTPDYQPEKKKDCFQELVSYTSPQYDYQVRESAFMYLRSMNLFNREALENLVDASKHFNWRLKKSSKDLLSALKKNPKYGLTITEIQNSGK